LKWKILEAELERNKSQHRSLIERYRLVVLDIFGLVLFPSLMSVISFEVVVVFVEYENTQVNLIATILDETIITIIHYRKLERGQSDVARSCCTYGW
jgi:lipoprotein NlpI